MDTEDKQRLQSRWLTAQGQQALASAIASLKAGKAFELALTGVVFVEEVYSGKDLRGAPLGDRELQGVDLHEVALDFAQLCNADLTRTNLRDAHLSHVDFSNAVLERADLSGCKALFSNFGGADLHDANLKRSNLSGANLIGATLVGADLAQTVLVGAKLDEETLGYATKQGAHCASLAPAESAKSVASGRVKAGERLPSEVEQELTVAIDKLFTAFSQYRKPSAPSPDLVGISQAELLAFYQQPVREISGETLATYARKALTTWGDADEFRYFLPRIFELLIKGPSGWCDPALVFGKLDAAGWRTWPQEEQVAVRGYLSALWDSVLENFPVTPRASEVLEGLSLASEPLAEYLRRWRQKSSVTALVRLGWDRV